MPMLRYATRRRSAGLEFRFESTVMDGVPIFNSVRKNLPGVKVLGFTGVLNSTSKVVIEPPCGKGSRWRMASKRRAGWG